MRIGDDTIAFALWCPMEAEDVPIFVSDASLEIIEVFDGLDRVRTSSIVGRNDPNNLTSRQGNWQITFERDRVHVVQGDGIPGVDCECFLLQQGETRSGYTLQRVSHGLDVALEGFVGVPASHRLGVG